MKEIKEVKTFVEMVKYWECPKCEEFVEYDGGRKAICPYCDEEVKIL